MAGSPNPGHSPALAQTEQETCDLAIQEVTLTLDHLAEQTLGPDSPILELIMKAFMCIEKLQGLPRLDLDTQRTITSLLCRSSLIMGALFIAETDIRREHQPNEERREVYYKEVNRKFQAGISAEYQAGISAEYQARMSQEAEREGQASANKVRAKAPKVITHKKKQDKEVELEPLIDRGKASRELADGNEEVGRASSYTQSMQGCKRRTRLGWLTRLGSCW